MAGRKSTGGRTTPRGGSAGGADQGTASRGGKRRTKGPAPSSETPAKRGARKSPTAEVARHLPVREGEEHWTSAELEDVREALDQEIAGLGEEIARAETDMAERLRDTYDGSGDDEVDTGARTFEREHEMSLANNARDLLAQNRRAVERIDDGTYGVCESCGNAIGKARLQAFPRATLCVTCKQREERR